MSRLERVMNARKFEDLAKESESCKKKLKFFAENGVTVQSVMEEKQAKARKQAQLIQRMKKMNTTPQGATGADAVLADIIAKEERKRAEARVPISSSEFKTTDGGRKTRKTRRKRRRKKRKSRRKKKTRRRRKKRKTRKRRR